MGQTNETDTDSTRGPALAARARRRARLAGVGAALVWLLASQALFGCADMVEGHDVSTGMAPMQGPTPAEAVPGAPAAGTDPMAGAHGASLRFTLRTADSGGGLAFVGVGGAIDGQVNPALHAGEGDMVTITLVNGEPAEHDIALPDLGVQSQRIRGSGAQTVIQFVAAKRGVFPYYCTLSGHRQAGMAGQLVVGALDAANPAGRGVSITRSPDDLPAPLGNRAPQTVRVDLEAVELEGRLADGATYQYWTFNGKTPGPFIRVRLGDTVQVTLRNRADSRMTHSIDLHAVTGPGGGAAVMQVAPGASQTFAFKALNPGLFVYHCATPMVAEHIARGMYGLILVEPPEGLPHVDHEFYVMQGEVYTVQPYGAQGLLDSSEEKLLAEQPEYFVFNGAVGALSAEHPLRAAVGDTVRIFFGVGGPNFTASFHVIGEIFDRVYSEGSLTSAPLTNVQTTLVPAGGATMVEITLQTPGRYTLVDHALSRAERGLMGALIVSGAPDPEIYRPGTEGGQ
jgi:nitrite reductase (NO-forming)